MLAALLVLLSYLFDQSCLYTYTLPITLHLFIVIPFVICTHIETISVLPSRHTLSSYR